MNDKTLILVNALNEIADYDYRSGKEGICPYGCDTPSIARRALQEYAAASQQANSADKDGQAVLEGVDYMVNYIDPYTISLTRC